PRLPIPTLAQTAERYLASLKPVLTETEWAKSSPIVKDFVRPGGEGERLQGLLQAYDRTQPTTWLDAWWLQCAYLEWREPLPVNSNYYIVGRDDPNQPPFQPPTVGGTFTPFQIRRAAHLINEALNYLEVIEQGRIPIEKGRQGAICMDQYYRMFGSTRIPRPGRDEIRRISPALSMQHITVLVKDQVYRVPVFAQAEPASPIRLAEGDIEDQLWAIIQDVERATTLDPPVSVLTGDQRDSWAENYAYLRGLSPINAEALDSIETALFMVCLDDFSQGEKYNDSIHNMMIGRNGHNRWFDKTVQIIVESSGRAGLNGEHAPCEALIPAYFFDYLLNIPTRYPDVIPRSNHRYSAPRRLRFQTDAHIHGMIQRAQAVITNLQRASQVTRINFEQYGNNFIKRVAKMGPDAYVQMALQLAYYRVHGHTTPTYETGSTRKYFRGRTETVRVLTTEAAAFVEAFGRQPGQVPSASDKKKVEHLYEALRRATTQHTRLASQAAEGQGVDRHLLGLKLAALKLSTTPATTLHPIFTDPAFTASTTWRLSTSSIHEGLNLIVAGFGCVVPEGGYGINYMKENERMKFGIEGK
ncbi:acyltransferase ChoActase/COT/CPT, partial [Dimargaris cristalligena]